MTEELIRKSDALAVVRPTGEKPCDCRGCRGSLPTAEGWARWDAFSRAADAIAALPAVTVPVVSQPVRYCPICDIADCATHREPAAIREAALREAAKRVTELMTLEVKSAVGDGYNLGLGTAYDAILALIAKGAAE